MLLLPAAIAAPFAQKSSQDPWPERQIDQGLLVPRGKLALGLAHDAKRSTATRDADGQVVPMAPGSTWYHRRTWLTVDQGFSRRITLYVHIPWVDALLLNDRGAMVQTRALGDVHTGLRTNPWPDAPTELAFQVDVKAPSGVEWPSDFIGGAANQAGFLTGTGVTNLGLHAHARQPLADVAALELRAGYVRKFAAIVGYVVETDGFGNGWLKAGDETVLSGRAEGQLGSQVLLHVDSQASWRGPYSIGTSGPSLRSVELSVVQDPSLVVDVGGGLSWAPDPQLELQAAAGWQLAGADTRTFGHLGLDEYAPMPGMETRVGVVIKW